MTTSSKQWPIVSQHPGVASPSAKRYAEAHYLPVLVKVWQDIERALGYRWHSTSYWRRSPSHRKGVSLDIAPDIAEDSKHRYAVFQMSDPVLYKRQKLMRDLQKFAHSHNYAPYSVGLFMEPDHIHIQLLQPEGTPKVSLLKWRLVKPVYSDSARRVQLPMITKGS